MDVSDVRNAPLPTPEHMLGKGSMMPFNCTNSGVRKLMFSTNLEQRLALVSPDVPYIETGYEDQFGKYSSSFERADQCYTVIAKIPKFSSKPHHHFFLIIRDQTGLELSVIERASYRHITESYGYIYNTDAIDFLAPGDYIQPGTVVRKSKAFDEYDNRMDGKNLLLMFDSSEQTMEDAIRISKSCSKKLASPLIHKIKVVINDNDIPLNLLGDMEHYKIFPDIGEKISDGILCSMRREKKEEALYSQSISRLMQPTISDDKYLVSGKVIDIDVYCNAPEKLLTSQYYEQINGYYTDHMRFCRAVVDTINPFLSSGATMTYELQKLYSNCLDEINGKQFFNERAFSNLNIDFTILEEIEVGVGDKITNRYGGKGVVSAVVEDYLMPKTPDGMTIDIQANRCGVYGRENTGQLFEMSLNHISMELAKCFSERDITTDECVQIYLDYLKEVSPSLYSYMDTLISNMSDDDVSFFISSIAQDGMIYLDIDPASETMTVDKLKEVYDKFPWVSQEYLTVPILDSTGKVRYVQTHRPLVYGYVYYYRLKQHGKEKFSVTSLSATNIKNENSRNKASKVYKARFSRTPIRFGDMESGNLIHMGADLVIQILMLYSASPEARMMCEQMITGDPYKVDIKLNDTSSNRNVEILNAYLKTIGLRLEFTRKAKIKKNPILISPVTFSPKKYYKPVIFYNPRELKDPKDVDKLLNAMNHPVLFDPVVFMRDPDTIDTSVYANKDMPVEE